MPSHRQNILSNHYLLAKVNNWLGSVEDYLCKLNYLNKKSMIKCQIDYKVSGNVSSDLKWRHGHLGYYRYYISIYHLTFEPTFLLIK